MTVFGGEPATTGVGFGLPMGGFLVTCCKCGWHSTVVYRDGKLICEREQCGNEAKLDDSEPGVPTDNAGDNEPDVLPEDIGKDCW